MIFLRNQETYIFSAFQSVLVYFTDIVFFFFFFLFAIVDKYYHLAQKLVTATAKIIMSCSSFNASDELTVWTQMNVGPDLDANRLTLIVFLKEFFFFLKKFILKKKVSRQQQNHEKLPSMQSE